MRLSKLKSVLADAVLTGDAEVLGVNFDSRRVKDGDLFVALVGAQADGHDFVRQAVVSGAAAVMVRKRMPAIAVPQLVVSDTRSALGKLAARFFDYPSRRLKVVGVTGTNGKTTTTYLIRSVLEAAGRPTGLIGTISYSTGGEEIEALNTTPESLVIQQLLGRMVQTGLVCAVMEVSSQALDQGRVDDVDFAAGVFTNLSPEHLDYHKDMPGYARAKGRLFGLLSPDAAAVFNVDDGNAARVVGGTRARLIGFGFGKGAQVRAVDCRTGPGGSRWRMVSPWGEVRLSTCLAGRHNVYNCLAAAAVTAALAVELPTVARGIAGVSSVRGRLESVDEGQDFAVFVDYAHTDDALENVLKAVRPMTMKRVIVVVGCGGDRDVSKRPRMRAVAGRLADHCVVTSDNPRSEDPMKIIEQMMHGATDASKFTIEPDRRAAITQAIGMARAGDVVLIAGKGHETSQIFGDRRVHFDDREVAGEVLRKAVSS